VADEAASDVVVADEDAPVVVASAVEDAGSPVYIVPTTRYSVACRFHVAQGFGFEGYTLNLPTPLSQQFAL
jgi:hypothetical protein